MSGAAGPPRRGRRGRRTARMTQIARERIADLFALAETESRRSEPDLADRYVALARRIGMRYNVRLLTEYRDLYCRGCSAYWVEGRTVRTRLRAGRRVRRCQRCGRVRRLPLAVRRPAHEPAGFSLSPAAASVGALVDDTGGDDDSDADEGQDP